MKLTKSIIIEGPDGSGKSSLFKIMTDGWGLHDSGHDGGPPLSSTDAALRLAMFAADAPSIRDRCVAISDIVYSEALHKETALDHALYLHWLRLFKPFVIMCLPPEETIMSNSLAAKPHKNLELVKAVTDSRAHIINRYRSMLGVLSHEHIKFHVYDYTSDAEAKHLKEQLEWWGVLCID